MIEKKYEPKSAENRIYQAWEDAGSFKAGAGASEGATPYSIVIPPPNVTGSLHIGHALNNTIQDILIRFERMRGKDVLWQPGMDHAGIATQMVVERQLAEQGLPSRKEMGREAFIKKVWEWKEESGGTIFNQLRRLGASCDWSRERFTMDEGLSEAVVKVFVELHKKGLIYKDKRLVNWDPTFQTAISDLEVEQKDVNGHMWSFAYPLVNGEVDGISEIVIATTRPETMLGDGAVAVHPSDERYKNLIGKMVRLPIAEREIPIIADEYPDPEFGTGAVKITGAHDFNDFEVARRNNIPLIPFMDSEAKMIVTPENNVPEHYRGLDRFVARKLVLKEIEELGFYRGVEEKIIAQPFGDRSGVVIEPMLTEQWYVKAETLAKPAAASVREGRTKFVPDNWKNTYYHWMDNIQPWCISRQLWWGHQIPAWYCIHVNSATRTAIHYNTHAPDHQLVFKTENEAMVAASEYYGGQPVKLVANRQEAMELLDNYSSRDGPIRPIWRDPDVLDTWFSSGLWAFSTLGWPDETDELKKYYPTSVLVTGFDIIFFWVARMMMLSLEFMEKEPFAKVYVHALVRDEQGQKMSKSKGNVIDPLELIDEYGADATRFTLAAMAAQGRDIRLSLPRVEGYRNFVTKIWNAARFLEMNDCQRVENFDPKAVKNPLNQWIIGEASRAVNDVTRTIEEFRFNEAANACYEFVWNKFCDWYIELAKPLFGGEDEAAKAETRATAAFTLDQILKLLHPFMPFVTEELWAQTGQDGASREKMLIISSWPELAGLENEKADAEISWLIALITSIRSVRAEMNVPASAKIPLHIVGEGEETRSKVNSQMAAIKRLARIENIEFSKNVPANSAQFVQGEATFGLPLGDVIDIEAEKARLNKSIAKLQAEIDGVDKKLSNEHFTSKAPEHVIEDQRKRKNDASEKRDKLAEALNRLS
ncbi:MAG: valine--tRNA ligase [Devosiaceae bacterium]|nr:valine--tRNA ligase [Devosiaceae bacterium]